MVALDVAFEGWVKIQQKTENKLLLSVILTLMNHQLLEEEEIEINEKSKKQSSKAAAKDCFHF